MKTGRETITPTNVEGEMLKVLQSSKGEREIASFLAKNPFLVRWSVCKTGGHSTYILKEFPFGSNFKADFVVAMSYSFAWEVHLIELEPPNDMVFTKRGLPSNRLNTALNQIKDWKTYIERNPTHFKKDLTDWCMKRDLLREEQRNYVPTNNTGNLLNSPDTFIRFHYYVFIGQRNNMDSEKATKINQYRSSDVNIHTFGRIQDVAKNYDRYNADPMQVGIRLTESPEER